MIEARAPRIAQAVGPDLFAHAAAIANERVVGRDLIARRDRVDVDAQDLAEQIGCVLRVRRNTDLARCNVEIAVRTEREPARIVISVGRRADVEDEVATRRRDVGIARDVIAPHLVVWRPGGRRRIDVERAVGGVVRIEREAEQAAFARDVDRHGKKWRRQHLPAIQVEDLDGAGLLDDEQPVRVAGSRRHIERLVEPARHEGRRNRGGRIGGVWIVAVDEVAARCARKRIAGVVAGHDVHCHACLRSPDTEIRSLFAWRSIRPDRFVAIRFGPNVGPVMLFPNLFEGVIGLYRLAAPPDTTNGEQHLVLSKPCLKFPQGRLKRLVHSRFIAGSGHLSCVDALTPSAATVHAPCYASNTARARGTPGCVPDRRRARSSR